MSQPVTKIIYSFNKTGYEADCYKSEIQAASDADNQFIPFNHGQYLDPSLYMDAWSLDRLFRNKHPNLMQMYAGLEACIREHDASALIVFNCPPYHPDFLINIPVYKALFSSDDPDSTYKRNIPYLHAYQHVLYVDPAYSAELDMSEKMRYCGMLNENWLPIGLKDYEFDPSQTESTLFARPRDIDIIYVGSCFRQKLPILARVKKAFGRRFRLHGVFRFTHNLYFNIKYGFPGWVRTVSFEERVRLYQRAKVGFNIHWSEYGLGNERLYHLPANGVMQISDCASHLGRVYKVGEEVVDYRDPDDLVRKLHYYLEHDDERQAIARRGYNRVMRDYRFRTITRLAGKLIQQGMQRISWKPL